MAKDRVIVNSITKFCINQPQFNKQILVWYIHIFYANRYLKFMLFIINICLNCEQLWFSKRNQYLIMKVKHQFLHKGLSILNYFLHFFSFNSFYFIHTLTTIQFLLIEYYLNNNKYSYNVISNDNQIKLWKTLMHKEKYQHRTQIENISIQKFNFEAHNQWITPKSR